MADPVIQNVADTAFWVAHWRAVESARPDALFRDPLAAVLTGERGRMIAAGMPMAPLTAWTVAIRTCVIDAYLRQALAEGVDAVLNLGAGLDARPYRLELPETLLWIEADHPGIIEYKEITLAEKRPCCRLERVKLDLTNDAARRDLFVRAGAQSRKLLVLTEGVVSYLSVEEAGGLADDLREIAHARYWIVDYFAPQILKHRRRFWSKRLARNVEFKFDPGDWFAFFAGHGWRPREMRYLPEEAMRLGRPVSLPWRLKILKQLLEIFSSRERRGALRKFSGYAWMESGAPGKPA